MKTYATSFLEDEMDFLRKLFQSEIGVTIQNVEIVARTKAKIMNATPILGGINPEDIPKP